jgi:clan AA aspartic protease
MIRGAVNARGEAIAPIRVRGPSGVEVTVDAVVDSGFTGSLTLPAATIALLGLVRQSGGSGTLAGGSTLPFDIYAAEVEWEGAWRAILASAVGAEALLGTRLLHGHTLRIDVVPGGIVEITPLP